MERVPTNGALSSFISVVCASLRVTTPMSAIELTLTASKKAAVHFEVRKRGTRGLRRATKRKDGRKMATVATTAPGKPAMRYPINVEVESTGPGVN
jgi:hypothetical protein